MRLQIYCIYMILIAFAYFLYLFADVRYHIYRTKNQFKDHIERTQHIDEYMKTGRAINKSGGIQVLFIFHKIAYIYFIGMHTVCVKHKYKESFVLNLILKFR